MIQTNQYSKLKCYLTIFCSFCAAIALTMTFKEPKIEDVYRQTTLSEVLWNFYYSCSNTSSKSTLLFCCFFLLGQNIKSISRERTKLVDYAAFLLAIVWLMGKCYAIDNSLYHAHSSVGQIVKSCIYVIGITWLLIQTGFLLECLVHDMSLSVNRHSPLKILQAQPFLVPFSLCLLFWLPHTIISYPGNMCYDAWDQLMQYNKIWPFTSHHPPVHTYLLGIFVDLGAFIKDGEFGIFLFILLQILFAATAVAYSVKTMIKLRAPVWLIYVSLICAALLPAYSSYVNVVLKDNLYAYSFLLFVTELVNCFGCGETFFKEKKHMILLPFSVCGVLLFRNNGKYIVYILAFILLCICLLTKQGRSFSKNRILRILFLILIPILIAGTVEGYLTGSREIVPGSRREMLSLPFQQTARYVSTYEYEIDDEERRAIDAILNYEKLSELYNPRISDPVKATFKDDATTADIMNYFHVWLKQFTKHPMVYVHATLNQNYYLLYPAIDNITLYSQTYNRSFSEYYSSMNGFSHTGDEIITDLEMTDRGFQQALYTIPVLGTLSHVAVYNTILLILVLFAINKRKWSWLLASVPLVLTNLIIIVSPVIQGHPRYAFPIIFSMPIMVAYYIYLEKQSQKTDN